MSRGRLRAGLLICALAASAAYAQKEAQSYAALIAQAQAALQAKDWAGAGLRPPCPREASPPSQARCGHLRQ